MHKRILSYALAFIMIASFMTLGLVFGSNERDQLNNVQSEINKSQSKLAQGKKTENDLLGQIKTLEGQMLATQAEIDKIGSDINQTQAKIDGAQADLNDLESKLNEQNDNLDARLRAMYMNGNIGAIDVLLGSNSISDFMTNLDRIQMVYESDKEVIATLEEQHKIIDTQKQYLEGLQAQLVADKDKEAGKKETLKQNQNAIAAKKTEVAADNALLEKYIDSMTDEANRLIAEILAKQSDSAYVGGDFLWPVPGYTRVTSEFGYRIHPILKVKKLHTGIDIACPLGTKVVAANAGRVMMAGWNDSYGYVVMIDHGGGRVTLYAHNSVLLVKEGDIVARGQQISKSGSTGMSTGPHMHFEVRINGEYKNPRDYL